jgi:hypothetical protein
MARIRDTIATAVDLTKCWLCGEPATSTARTIVGFKIGVCDFHSDRKKD